MFIPPTDDQRICAWFECQTEETLRDLHERFDAVSPRECWTAFFNDCSSPAPESLGVSLAVPVEAVQEVCAPTLEQFQRWLEIEGHRAYHDSTVDVLHLVRCCAAIFLLMEFKGQA